MRHQYIKAFTPAFKYGYHKQKQKNIGSVCMSLHRWKIFLESNLICCKNCIRIFLCIYTRNYYETFSRKAIFINISSMLLATSSKDTTTLKCNSNTATEYTDKCDQRMKTINRDEKGLCVMPDVPSWACVASAICIKAFSFLLNRILTLWTSP